MRILKVAGSLLLSWILCPALSPGEKLSYLWQLCRYALDRRQGHVHYLGSPFAFDNPKTPFVLLRYPQDVAVDLLGQVETPLHSVLDIGGNIGQFAVTLLRFRPELQTLDVFEPNATVFPFLQQNLRTRPQAHLYPFGVGRPGQRTLFAVANASSTASFVKNRAEHSGSSTSRRSEEEIPVEVISDVASHTGRNSYDLVKIDVEGAEFEVLETLSLKTRYFWLELSGRQFGGNSHRTSEVYDLIRRRFGEFDVLFQSRWSAGTVCDILIEIVGPPAG